MQDTLHYRLVFDAATQGHPGWGNVPTIALMALGLAALALFLRFGASAAYRAEMRNHLVMYSLGAILLTGFAAIELALPRLEFNRIRERLRRGDFEVVTGEVRYFIPEGEGGHGESFSVGQRRYVYFTGDATGAFHQTVPMGGPMRDGLRVRIADVDGAIARLEIAR